MRWLGLFAILAFAVDQLTKELVVFQGGLTTDLVQEVAFPFLTYKMGWNCGINFGIFGECSDFSRWFLVVISIAISAGLLIWALRGMMNRIEYVSVGLIIGGALGNVIDRVRFGAVVDFINVSCCGINNPFAFNLADVFIFMGAFGLILWSGKQKTP